MGATGGARKYPASSDDAVAVGVSGATGALMGARKTRAPKYVGVHYPIRPARRVGLTLQTPLGGPWWRCESCGSTIEAPCSCCEPPRCNCTQVRT